jgi:type VI protein secretion system component VasK
MHTSAVDRHGPGAPRASRVVVVLAWALAMLVAGAVTSWAVTVISGEQGPARDQVLAASQVTAELAAQRAVSGAAPIAPSPAAVPTPEPSTGVA